MRVDGSVFKGQWDAGLQHGDGTLTFKDGTKFAGQYVQGVKSGKGNFVIESSNFEGATGGCSYDGAFENDTFHGEGVFKWGDGRKYEGQWKGGLMDGKGTFTFR